ncbi:MAG: amino acid adenylation domain-containing protein, partial [Myxococcota bacterium]
FPSVDGEPVRVDGPRPRLVREDVDAATLRTRLDAEARRPFRLDAEPALRAFLFAVDGAPGGPRHHVLQVVAHHLVTDLTAQAVLLEELERLYVAARDRVPDGLPAPIDPGGYVAWQDQLLAGPDGARLERDQLAALDGAPEGLALPTRPRPPVRETVGAETPVALDAATTARVHAVARSLGVTPFVLLLTAFQALLFRYTGQRDLVVGTVTSGRTRPAHARMIGSFVNPVALRARLGSDTPFSAAVAASRTEVARALRDQDLPFARLVAARRGDRDPSRAPLFQATFVLQPGPLAGFAVDDPTATLAWGGLTLRPVPLDRRIAQHDLGLTLAEVDGRLVGRFDHPVGLFAPDTVPQLAEAFRRLVAGIVADPHAAIGALPVLSDADRAAQLVAAAVPTDPRPIHARVFAQAAARPHAIAIRCGSDVRTYRQLADDATRWARLLVADGVCPEDVVGVCVDRGVDLPALALAVLAAGAAWLPLDPAYPEARRAAILADAGATRVLDRAPRDIAVPVAVRLPDVHPDQQATVIYTSGSTGAPKGVPLTHRGLGNLVDSFVDCYGATPDDAILPATSIASASFVGELLPLLCAGGSVVIPTAAELVDEAALSARIVADRVTILSTVPSRLVGLGSGGTALRWVLSGGEALTAAAASALGATLVNGSGLTETTACSTWHVVRPEDRDGTAPIGRPVRNTRVYVLDDGLEPVAPGVEGELYVGGLGLARGYHRDPAATAVRFVPDPFTAGERLFRTGDRATRDADGLLRFAGRTDHQVKIRGHRIELEDVEATLARHPDVADAAVTVHGEGADRRLAGYVVARPGVEVRPGEVLAFVRRDQPEARVPSTITVLPSLPLSPNGKVDRAALPEPERIRPDVGGFSAPRSALERDVARVWAEVLGLDQVGVTDNFFDLGGHSLLLSKLHARLDAELGLGLSLVDLFRFPTVAAQAAHAAAGGARVEAAVPARSTHREPLAIVGMAGRFPGAADPDALWAMLTDGIEGLTRFTDDALREAGVDDATLADPTYVKAKGTLGGVDQFDAGFFGYSPREAAVIDPQQRLFLECAWEAVERAGYDPSRYPGRIGVFGGVSMNTYLLLNLMPHLELVASLDTLQASLGNDKDLVTSRVSYKLGLTGPSVTVQSASSTSLVAVHVACEALLAGSCDMALAGGASIHVPEVGGYRYQPGGTTAIDGHCRAYDADATGFVSGNGAGVVLIKRLSDAIRDRDHVHAVIRGTACNNDGANKVSWTAPSVDGQADVYREALAAAGVGPADVGYVEGHGTGTAMGDPIELAALNRAYAGATEIALGSLKTNIGHLDTAAGVCGLIKAALVVERGEHVPTLHFRTPNPRATFGPFRVDTSRRPWTRSPRIAGVTSLGMGGTNAHVILAEPPPPPPSGPSRGLQLLALSARTPEALDRAAAALADHLASSDVALADVAHTLGRGRKEFAHRRTVVAADRAAAIDALRAGSGGASGDRGQADGSTRSIAFLFPGQGAQYAGMGRGLYDREPVYRAALDEAAEGLVPHLGLDLRAVLHGDDHAALARTAITQPALFAVERAVAVWLRAHGVEPAALVGHSLGEYVAAHLAGVFDLQDALRLVAVRGRLMQEMPPGAMLAVSLPAGAVPLPPRVEVAAINHPDGCVVSGPIDAIDALEGALARDGVVARRLHTSHAFHSAMLDPAAAAFEREVHRARLAPPTIPFLSNVTGTWITASEATDPAYWARQLRAPVRFADAARALLADPGRLAIEVGPGNTLAGFVRTHPDRAAGHDVLTTLRHPKEVADDQETLLRAVGRCWTVGGPAPDLHRGEDRRRVALPTYPFERSRHWVDPPTGVRTAPAVRDVRTPPDTWISVPTFTELPPPSPRAARRTAVAGALPDGLAARLGAVPLAIDDVASVASERPECVVYGVRDGDDALFGPLAVARSLAVRFPGAPIELVVVTAGVFDLTGAERLDPARAAALGPVRVLPLEVPGLTTRLIDLDPGSSRSAPSITALAAEIRDGDAPEVALRGRRRWALGYSSVITAGPARDATAPTGSGSPSGTWLVTGGTRGIGLAIARWLAAHPGVTVTAVGRSAPDDADRAALDALGVETVAADVATDAGARTAVARAVARFGAVHGWVHAAGVAGGRLAISGDHAAAMQVLAPKVAGALAVERALAGQPVARVVLCSSLTATVAMPGQVDYVAANAVLDALAAARSRDGGARWISVGWDAWRETGMAVRAHAVQPDEQGASALGDGPLGAIRAELLRDGLTTDEGLALFARALGSEDHDAPGPQWVV